jgi:tRNA(adenine34) deaminase
MDELAGPAAEDDVDVVFMRMAITEAEAAGVAGDVPIGAVVVRDGAVIGRGRNRRELDADPTGHAEIVALRDATVGTSSWRLVGATVYATLEPCPMCAGALVNARVSRVVYACPDPKAGAIDTLYELGRDMRLNHRFDVRSGVLSEACASLLKTFFAARRPRR